MPLSGAPLAAPDGPPDTFVRGFLAVWLVSRRSEGLAEIVRVALASALTLGACLTLKLPTSGRQQATIGLPCSTRRLRSCSR